MWDVNGADLLDRCNLTIWHTEEMQVLLKQMNLVPVFEDRGERCTPDSIANN